MSSSHKLFSLEGLRGIAAFVVLIAHLRITFFVTSAAGISAHLSFLPYVFARPILAVIEACYSGEFAVWLFWIMSAFVLSLQFFVRAGEASSDSAHDYLEDAVLRRYPRLLLPVMASVLFAYAIHALGWMHNRALAHALGEPYVAALWEKLYAFPPSFAGALKSAMWESFFAFDLATSYNSVLHTMEREFYGSLFLFAFLGSLGRRKSRWFAYAVMMPVNHALDLPWLNAFVAGIVLCDAYVNLGHLPNAMKELRNSRWLAVVLWGLVAMGAGLQNYGHVCYLLAGSAALALALVSIPTQRFLSASLPLFLGRVSFGLYLVHRPLICSFSGWAYLEMVRREMAPTVAAWLVSIATCILSIVLGYALYRAVDRPSLGIARSFSSFIIRAAGKRRCA